MGQQFTFTKRAVTWLPLQNIKPVENKWRALCEFQVWGRDAGRNSGPRQ